MSDAPSQNEPPKQPEPKDVSKLTRAETQRGLDYLNDLSRKHGRHICPSCQSSDWILNDVFVELRPFHGGSMIVGGTVFPMVMIHCKTCGYSFLMSALLTKIYDKAEREKNG